MLLCRQLCKVCGYRIRKNLLVLVHQRGASKDKIQLEGASSVNSSCHHRHPMTVSVASAEICCLDAHDVQTADFYLLQQW